MYITKFINNVYGGKTYNKLFVVLLENLFVLILSLYSNNVLFSTWFCRNAWGSVVVCLFDVVYSILSADWLGLDINWEGLLW